MSEACAHCGYFIEYVHPKAPAEPGWQHTPYRPHKPTNGAGPCDKPEPTR